jgi:hypothetical protein
MGGRNHFVKHAIGPKNLGADSHNTNVGTSVKGTATQNAARGEERAEGV